MKTRHSNVLLEQDGRNFESCLSTTFGRLAFWIRTMFLVVLWNICLVNHSKYVENDLPMGV